MSEHLDHAKEFMELAGITEEAQGHVMKRLRKAAKEYGDASYDRPPMALLGEIEQEAEDLIGWPFIMWRKMQIIIETNKSPSARKYAQEMAQAMILVAADAGVMCDSLRDIRDRFQ